jgi:TPR repeat protein
VVVLWCSLSVGSRWVIEEADLAYDLGRLIPVKIEPCELPVGFRRQDYTDLSSWDGSPRSHQLDTLIEALEQRIGRPALVDLKGLREYEATWRRFGAPSLRAFALGELVAPVEGDRAMARAEMTSHPAARLNNSYLQYLADLEERKRHDEEAFELASRAFRFETGTGGLPKDEKEAVHLYKLAADKGCAYAQSNLGVMYQTGRGGLPKDDREAVRLYKLAADQLNTHAQLNLGLMYLHGRGGLTQDDRAAARLFRLAADRRNAGAQLQLGLMYLVGRGGLPCHNGEAVRLISLAAGEGDAAAKQELFRLAADRRNARAQLKLGLMYLDSRGGLPRDNKEAARLIKLAADQGDETAKQALIRLGC